MENQTPLTMAHHVGEEDQMSTEELLQAQTELYRHCLAYINSMALRAATHLRIPDVICRRGGTATLSDISAGIGIHPTKISHLRRLMRVLTVSGIFTTIVKDRDDGEATVFYTLTRVSRLLVGGGSPHCLSPMVDVIVNPAAMTTHLSMGGWFTGEQAATVSLFEVVHGCTRQEMMKRDPEDGAVFNAAMVADSGVVMEIILKESHGSGIFEGVTSLVDVGGGHGAVAGAVARAFPHVKCTVMDLPHVVVGAPTGGDVQFVAGNLFEYIPPADVVLLKWILHCWEDEECVKVLRRCKEAIPPRDAGGKVIIIDMVVGSEKSEEDVSKETQVMFDVYIMYVNGIEREEHEWRRIFLEAGFSDYKITPVLGVRSVIEVYP